MNFLKLSKESFNIKETRSKRKNLGIGPPKVDD